MADAEKKVWVRFEAGCVLEDEYRKMIGSFEAGSIHELPVSSFLFWAAQGKAREAAPEEVKEAQSRARAAKAAPEKPAAPGQSENTKGVSHAEAATAPAAVGEPAKPAADKRR